MKCLVTGGAGFIGSHLCQRLAHLGHHVYSLDNLSSGNRTNLDAAGDVEFVHGSILDAELVADLVGESDVVFHLAAAVGVRTIVEDPIGSLRTNLRGTETVLEQALRHRRPVLVASTSEVYGLNAADALSEDSRRIIGSPLTARWSYAEAKAIDETLTYTYWRQHGLPTVIVRPFNIVGPRQTGRYGMVIPRFVGQALRGEPLTVYGDGTQTRCFCHVDDIIDPLIELIGNPRAHGTAVNLGRFEEVTIDELANRVIVMTGSSSTVRYVPYTEAYPEGFEDMQRRVPDISRARELIEFEPGHTLDEILRDIIDHERSRQAPMVGATS